MKHAKRSPFNLALSASEKIAFERAAIMHPMTLSAWMRKGLRDLCKAELAKSGLRPAFEIAEEAMMHKSDTDEKMGKTGT